MAVSVMDGTATEPVKIDGRNIIVLYGSETGNAEEIAMELAGMTRRLHFKTTVDEMDNIKLTELIQCRLAIFVTSTTGQGDLPRNTEKFWKNLRRTRLNNTNCLGPLEFTIFGLGDSSYPNVNAAARKLRSRLLQLGAAEFFKPGEGDERHDNGIDSVYQPWSKELRDHLITNYPLSENIRPLSDETGLPPRYHIDCLLPEAVVSKKSAQDIPPDDLLAIPKSLLATVHDNERVTPESHWQDVRRLSITVQIDNQANYPFLPYTAGATLGIYPKNFPEDVQTVIDMMGWHSLADNPLNPQTSSLPKKLYPLETGNPTLRDLLLHNFDITAIPKRSFLRQLSHFTTDENEKERLISLTTPSYQEEFYDYTSRPRRTILEVLRDFPSVRIPFSRAPEVFPLIRGREFSICTGANAIGDNLKDDGLLKIDILVALVEYKTIIRKPRQGLCSRYIKHLAPGTSIKVTINPPSSPTLHPHNMVTSSQQGRPVIAVATGTGIAPIRALIGDCLAAKTDSQILLFFGCRNKHADYFFEEEWNSNAKLKAIPAFSRDKSTDEVDAGGKNYVQYQIRRHAVEVAGILTGDVTPVICVCGNSGRMPAAVREAFEDVLVGQGVVGGREEAIKWLGDRGNVVYWQETW